MRRALPTMLPLAAAIAPAQADAGACAGSGALLVVIHQLSPIARQAMPPDGAFLWLREELLDPGLGTPRREPELAPATDLVLVRSEPPLEIPMPREQLAPNLIARRAAAPIAPGVYELHGTAHRQLVVERSVPPAAPADPHPTRRPPRRSVRRPLAARHELGGDLGAPLACAPRGRRDRALRRRSPLAAARVRSRRVVRGPDRRRTLQPLGRRVDPARDRGARALRRSLGPPRPDVSADDRAMIPAPPIAVPPPVEAANLATKREHSSTGSQRTSMI